MGEWQMTAVTLRLDAGIVKPDSSQEGVSERSTNKNKHLDMEIKE